MAASDALGFVFWDGLRLDTRERPGARRLGIDARTLTGATAGEMWAHVCALTDDLARVPYDDPAVQQARRDAFAWWIPMLGDQLVCLSTFSIDSVYCAGAVTVLRNPELVNDDPFARLFPGVLIRVEGFAVVPPPAGPVIERYAGAPWPGGRF